MIIGPKPINQNVAWRDAGWIGEERMEEEVLGGFKGDRRRLDRYSWFAQLAAPPKTCKDTQQQIGETTPEGLFTMRLPPHCP